MRDDTGERSFRTNQQPVYVLNYIHDRLTNAVCEGINSMIQAAKRKDRGFNTYEGYEAMICLVGGKLELAVKTPLCGQLPLKRE